MLEYRGRGMGILPMRFTGRKPVPRRAAERRYPNVKNLR
jgi:hypothetical protein